MLLVFERRRSAPLSSVVRVALDAVGLVVEVEMPAVAGRAASEEECKEDAGREGGAGDEDAGEEGGHG
jgi:hypothetical protein